MAQKLLYFQHKGLVVSSVPPVPSGWAGDEWKMSVSGLKAELKFLESIFDPNHERFRIIDWKPDELSCQFNVTGEKLLIIHCNITVMMERKGATINHERSQQGYLGTES